MTQQDVDLRALAGEFLYPTVKITVVPERGFGGTRTLRQEECAAIVAALRALANEQLAGK